MPDRSGTWGRELSDDDFACAVAEAGVHREIGDGHVGWDWWETPSVAARELADRWRARRAKMPRMRVWMTSYSVDAWQWLVRPAVGIDALMILRPLVDPKAAPEQWTWPWQLVDATRGSRLRATLHASPWRPRTIQDAELDERVAAGLLIVDGPVSAAIAMLARDHRRLKANAVLVVGSIEPAAQALPWLGWALGDQVEASMVMFGVPDDNAQIVRLIEETSIELSHDEPLDRALLTAARRIGIDPPILHGDPSAVERARLSNRGSYLLDKLKALQEVGAKLAHPFGFETTRVDLDQIKQGFDWSQEARGATQIAELARQQRERDTSSANKMPPRYLQAQLKKDGDSAAASVVAPGASYSVMVKIGEFDPRLLAVINPIREPYAGIDIPVDVIVSEKNLLPVPLRATITLPPNGSSTEAIFPLQTRVGVASLELRVTVLHRNRVLQSGIIRAAIDGHDPLRFDVDAIGRHHLSGLENRRQFDAAIVANHALDGSAGFVGAVPDGVGYINLDPGQMQALTKALGDSISNIAIDPVRYRELDSEGTVEVLRELAQRGAAFHRLLVKHNGIGKGLLDAERIQVIAARPNTFLPLELAYAYPAPQDKAPLCENAKNALRDGKCTDTCGGRDGSRVCPLGFWGMSRVIERQAHRWQPGPTASDFRVEAEDRSKYTEATTPERAKIPPPTGVVFATSDRVDAADTTASATLCTSLEATFGAPNVKRVADWTQWVAAVTASKRPSLLVVVPHHKTSPQNDAILEIGKDSELRALLVSDDHVYGKPPSSPPPSPIVFLLGCETANAQVANESFVSVFRDFDAAIVISTISTVLGRDAAPVAAALAQAIVEQHRQGGGFLGDALVKMRRKMLLDGKAMVLALTAYGDADWMLAPA
jgi:hypothetical protein